MNIRPATEKDTPAIIELLRISLGETLIPKSENLWNWKHLDNPFGRSPILLAESDGLITGVRAFLKWQFMCDGKLINACRAVDTATHPDFQGKGIFKMLTLALLEEMKNEDVSFVYNTPNTNSTPGYLKMGWESWGKLPLKLNFHLGNSGKIDPIFSDWSRIDELVKKIEAPDRESAGCVTHAVRGYLHWRYRDNPLYQYQTVTDGESFLLVYRLKEGKMGREFRICDLYTLQVFTSKHQMELKKLLQQHIKSSRARFSSFSGLCYPSQNGVDLGLLPILKIGPLVTLRQLYPDFAPSSQTWAWSLGDLEVF